MTFTCHSWFSVMPRSELTYLLSVVIIYCGTLAYTHTCSLRGQYFTYNVHQIIAWLARNETSGNRLIQNCHVGIVNKVEWFPNPWIYIYPSHRFCQHIILTVYLMNVSYISGLLAAARRVVFLTQRSTHACISYSSSSSGNYCTF